MRAPTFIRLEGDPDADDIRKFLYELVERQVSIPTGKLFASLSLLKPARRLAENLARELAILSQRSVHKIVSDGLMESETAALLELEDCGMSLSNLTVAHGLLNIRERHFLAKSMRGFFSKHRELTGYLSLSDDTET